MTSFLYVQGVYALNYLYQSGVRHVQDRNNIFKYYRNWQILTCKSEIKNKVQFVQLWPMVLGTFCTITIHFLTALWSFFYILFNGSSWFFLIMNICLGATFNNISVIFLGSIFIAGGNQSTKIKCTLRIP